MTCRYVWQVESSEDDEVSEGESLEDGKLSRRKMMMWKPFDYLSRDYD